MKLLEEMLTNKKWKSKLIQFKGIQTSTQNQNEPRIRMALTILGKTNASDRKNLQKRRMERIYFSTAMNLWLQWRQICNLSRIRLKLKIIEKKIS